MCGHLVYSQGMTTPTSTDPRKQAIYDRLIAEGFTFQASDATWHRDGQYGRLEWEADFSGARIQPPSTETVERNGVTMPRRSAPIWTNA